MGEFGSRFELAEMVEVELNVTILDEGPWVSEHVNDEKLSSSLALSKSRG